MSPHRPPLSRSLASLVALAVLALAGCANGTTENDPAESSTAQTRVFTANNGDIEIPTDPQRIVALSYAVPSLLVTDAPLVCSTTMGQTQLDLLPDGDALARYEKIAKVESGQAKKNQGGGTAVDYEAILALKPDLIVAGFPAVREELLDEQKLQAIAPTVYVGPAESSEWREVGAKAADAAGVASEFDTQKQQYDDLVEELKTKYADKTDGTVFASATVYESTESGSYIRDYSGSNTTNIPESIGMQFPGGTGGKGEQAELLSLERISDLADADVLLVSVNEDGSIRDPRFEKEVMSSQLWSELPAVQAGRVLKVPYSQSTTYPGAIECLKALDKQLEGLDVE